MKNGKRVLTTVLFIALIALLGWYVWANREDMSALLALSAGTLAQLMALAFMSCLVNSLYHREILLFMGLKLDTVDWLGVVSVSNAIAYVLPLRADLVFSAAYYKKNKALGYTRSASIAGGNIVFGVAFALIQVIAALLCIGFIDGVWPGVIWAVALVCAFVTAAVMLLSRGLSGKASAALEKHPMIKTVTEGYVALLTCPRLIAKLMLWQTLSHLITLVSTMICFRQIGVETTFYQAMFYAGVSWLSGIVAIVPGNIGIKESIMGVSTMMLGSVFQSGVAVSLLQRVTVMIAYVTLGLAFAWPVYKRMGR